MTSEDRDYEATIRHALHATAESIEPAGDGLERIRHRVAPPRPATSLLPSLAAWSRLAAIKLRGRLEPAVWLRPVLAIAGAAAIMIAGIFALSRVQQSITPADSVSTPGTTHHPVRASSPTQTALGALPMGVEPSPTTSLPGQHSTAVLPVIPPTPTVSAAPHASSTPAPNATTTPSPNATATPTSTATATPTSTPTSTPTATPTATPTSTASSTPTATPTSTDTRTPAAQPTPIAPADNDEVGGQWARDPGHAVTPGSE